MVTKEEENFLRVVHLNYHVGTTALRRYFDNLHPNLPSDLSSPSNKAILLDLHKPPRRQKRVLYQQQWDILYPSTGSCAVSSSDLDVTLMVCLLRNLPPKVSEPPNGFDALPQPSDLSPGDHIARIKYYKNFIVSHSKDGKLLDIDFNTIWIDMETAISGLGNQQDVTDAIDAKTKLLDYTALQEQVILSDNIQQNRKRLNEQSVELAEHSSKIAKLETAVGHLAKGKDRSEKAETTCKKAKLETTDEHIEKGIFKEFEDELIHSTVLDKEVLDYLISKCIILLDDREDIDICTDQSSRNQNLLKLLSHRPYNTLGMLVEAMKESDQKCHTLLLANMVAKVPDIDVTLPQLPHKDEISDIENQTVRLIKWYKPIVHSIDVEKTEILDKLKDVLSSEEIAEIRSINISKEEKNRGLLGKIIRKNNSSTNKMFLEVLTEDRCYKEYATKIEETDVTQFDLELLSIGNSLRERKRSKRDRKRREENGISDFMIEKLETWKKDDSLYIETRATKHALSCVSKYNCVSVIGPSGCGKTALVRHVALQLEQNGYTIITVIDAKDITDKYKSGRKTLYIVDDMCGNFTANQTRIEEWKKSMNDIKSILENGNCKLILTCRLQVFKDKMFANLEMFKTCECNLRSDGLSLTPMEKENMTARYFKEHALEALKRLGEFEFLPLLCKLYHVQRNNPQFNLDVFLNDAFSFYNNELHRMYIDCTEGKYKYCALLLLVIFNNKLKDTLFKGKDPKVKEIKQDVIEVCEIDENITQDTGRKLMSQLQTLIGTFVTYDDGIFQTIHDKLFDFLAFYFGTQKQIIDILIKHAKNRFIHERLVVSDDTKSSGYSIVLSNDKLQMYLKRVLDELVISPNVKIAIIGNENLKNVNFRMMLIDFMRTLSKHEITAVMEKANAVFLNIMFVKKQKDIKYKFLDFFQKYKCFGIILPDDMFHQYIEKWFYCLIETDSTEKFIKENRLLKHVSFRTPLQFYMRQLNQKNVASIIRTCSKDFLNTMFVMTEIDVIHCAKKPNERFGIIIPESMLQDYIDRWFDVLRNHVVKNEMNNTYMMPFEIEKNTFVGVVQNKNRPLKNFAFGNALRIYTKKLTTEQIDLFIRTSGDYFLNTMFVMTEDDINDSATNRYEWFGIVIPDNMLQQYIERIFNGWTNESLLVEYIDINRVLNNAKGCTALSTHMKQLTKEKTAALIQNAGHIFFNTMFVMTEEDIKDNAKYRYECCGIVIPDDLVQQYIERLFDDLTKTISVEVVFQENRPLNNVTFRSMLRTFIKQLTTDKICLIIQSANNAFINKMFVMTEDQIRNIADNGYECFGIVIPHVLLQQYIQRWFEDLTKADRVDDILDKNRLLLNTTFHCAVKTYIKQLTTEQIASIIQTKKINILNALFVMTENDIKSDVANRHKCLYIVIPDDLVQQYIDRLFDELKEIRFVNPINENIALMSVKLRSAVRTCMKNLPTDKIASIIHEAEVDFLITMFFTTEEDIKDDFSNRHECFGIVIPDDLLQQYIVRLFECLTVPTTLAKLRKSIGNGLVVNVFEICRPLNTVRFHTALRTYMRQLSTDKIGDLIQTARYDFINTMFVMTEDDINDNSDNQYERFGIVMPNDLLQQYIARWFAGLVKADMLGKIQHKNRVIKNVTFRIAFQTYLRKISTKKIVSIIQTAKDDFFNAIFVMTEDDIKEYATNRNESYGIIIPDELLQQYIQRLFNDLTKKDSVKDIIDKNRPLRNAQFRSVMRTYMKQLVTKQIHSLINNTGDSFLYTMFVMTKEDIKDDAANLYECFGIVIPDDILQQYIARCFEYLTETSDYKIQRKNIFWINKTCSIENFMENCRPLKNARFRTALRTFMRQLNTEKIGYLIHNAGYGFFNTMFVMTEEDVNDNARNRYECICIIIPDDLLEQYIKRWFNDLAQTDCVEEYINMNRPLNNASCRTQVLTYMRQLDEIKIGTLIQTGSRDFVNTMFVVTKEDIKDKAENKCECFGIILPGDLLQQYIERLFDGLTKANLVKKSMHANRCFMHGCFRKAINNYTQKLTRGKIGNLIRTASIDFVSTIFVMTEDDIKDDVEKRNECIGVVIPDDLLNEYIERWFDGLTKTHSANQYIDVNRTFVNSKFQANLDSYINGINAKKISLLNRKGHIDYINTRRNLFKETSEIKS